MDRTAVNQAPGGGTLYPFSGATALLPSVLDFYLSYEDDGCLLALPFSLEVSGASLSVLDATDALVASYALSEASSTPWGSRTVYEWVGASTVARIVTTGLSDGIGVLDPRTVERMPARVRSIKVGLQTFTGNLVFESGYNIDMSGVAGAGNDGGRHVNALNMDAVPGAGFGRQPGCEETQPVVRRINHVSPDDGGNFLITFDGCFRGQLVTTAVEEDGVGATAQYGGGDLTAEEARASLKVFSDCKPCYDCDYFVRTYRGLKRVWDKWQAVAANAEDARDVYAANRQRWLDQLACRVANPARLVAVPEAKCKSFFGGSYCNLTKCCVSPIELRFTMQKYKAGSPAAWPTGGVQVVEAYLTGSSTGGEVKAVPVVSGPVISFTLDFANPQQTSTARFRLCVTCEADETVRTTFTVHAPDPAPDPNTGDSCVLGEVVVSDEITSLWSAAGVGGDAARAYLQKLVPLDPLPRQAACDC